jgi:hypothetical protein
MCANRTAHPRGPGPAPFRAPAPLVRPLSYPIGALAVEWHRSPPVHRRSRPRRCLGSCRRQATRGQAEEIEMARGLLTRRTQTRTLVVGRLARRPPPRRAGARTQDRHRGAGSLTSPSSRASRCATCAGSEAGGATSRLTRPAPRSGDRRVCARGPSSRSAAGARRTGASKVTKPSYHRPVSPAWHAVEPLLHAPVNGNRKVHRDQEAKSAPVWGRLAVQAEGRRPGA